MAYKCLVCGYIEATENPPATCHFCGTAGDQEYTDEIPSELKRYPSEGTLPNVPAATEILEEIVDATMEDIFPPTLTREKDPNEPEEPKQQEEGLL